MNEKEFKDLRDWLKDMGAKIHYIDDFVDENLDSDPIAKEVLIEKAVTPLHYFKQNRPFRRGDE